MDLLLFGKNSGISIGKHKAKNKTLKSYFLDSDWELAFHMKKV